MELWHPSTTTTTKTTSDDERIPALAQRLQELEYQLVSHLLSQGSRGGLDNSFQSIPYSLPVLLIDNVFNPSLLSSSSNKRNENEENEEDDDDDEDNHLYYQKTHLLSREVEEFGGFGHEGCFPLLRLAQLILYGYSLGVLEGAFTVDTTPYRKMGDETLFDHNNDDVIDDPTTERFRRHRRNLLCAANCVYLEKQEDDSGKGGTAGDDLRDQILQHEVLRAVQARTLWMAAATSQAL